MPKPSKILARVKQAIREPYAWPGGYPLYVVTHDGAALSVEAARAEWSQIVRSTLQHARDGWRVERTCINWEDPALYCDHTGIRIPSAYAEDDAEPATTPTTD
jgi:hypothetical protein